MVRRVTGTNDPKAKQTIREVGCFVSEEQVKTMAILLDERIEHAREVSEVIALARERALCGFLLRMVRMGYEVQCWNAASVTPHNVWLDGQIVDRSDDQVCSPPPFSDGCGEAFCDCRFKPDDGAAARKFAAFHDANNVMLMHDPCDDPDCPWCIGDDEIDDDDDDDGDTSQRLEPRKGSSTGPGLSEFIGRLWGLPALA